MESACQTVASSNPTMSTKTFLGLVHFGLVIVVFREFVLLILLVVLHLFMTPACLFDIAAKHLRHVISIIPSSAQCWLKLEPGTKLQFR